MIATSISKKNLSDLNHLMSEMKFFLEGVRDRKFRKKQVIANEIIKIQALVTNFRDQSKSNPKLRSLSPVLGKIITSLSGIKNGLDNDQIIDLSGFSLSVKNSILPNYRHIKSLVESIDVQEEKETDNTKEVSRNEGFNAVLQKIKESYNKNETKENDNIDDTQSKRLINNFEKEKYKLPTSLQGKAFQVLKLPVVTNFASPILNSAAHARKSGIKVESFDTGHRIVRVRGSATDGIINRQDSITIFLDQPILAFDINFASEDRKKVGFIPKLENKKQARDKKLTELQKKLNELKDAYRKVGSSKTRSHKKEEYKKQIDEISDQIAQLEKTKNIVTTTKSLELERVDIGRIQQFLMEFIETINEHSPTKYTIASNYFAVNPANPSIRFAWLMPVNVYRSFVRGVPSTKGTWSFPWKHENASAL